MARVLILDDDDAFRGTLADAVPDLGRAMRGAFTGATADWAEAFRDADGGTPCQGQPGDPALANQAEILRKHRADVVGMFPDAASIARLVGAILLERNDEWLFQRRCMTLETMADRTDEQPAALTHIAA